MRPLMLSELARALTTSVQGGDVEVADIVTDSRKPLAGALFVALAGPNFDGHDFLAAAKAAGAVAALVERAGDYPLPHLVVADTRAALGVLARHLRQGLAARVVGITGSNGKTTVKEMIAAILATQGETLATRGNLNNDIGVPLTLFRLQPEHRYAVIEMGANHAGEIEQLARIVSPDVGVVTNAGPAHLEGFGSIEGVAHAKGELFRELPPGGRAVINADDRYAPLWREFAGDRETIDFGLERAAAVTASELGPDGFSLHTPQGTARVRLPLPGRHNVLNALAASAVGHALGVPLADIVRGLEGLAAVKGRLQRSRGQRGARLIDDTYNANPASLRAGLAVLAAEGGRRVLVLGDMAELGSDAAQLHAQVGDWAREAGVDAVYAVGRMARHAVQRFGAGGRHFETKSALLAALRPELAEDVVVLVKGSRSAAMEEVVAGLSAESGEAS